MSDAEIERLREELARLEAAIAGLAGMPEAQAPLARQRAAKERELARLEGRAPAGGTHVDQSGQSGGVSFGAGNRFEGPITFGDLAGRDIIKPQGPIILDGVHSGRDTNIAAGDQTIITREGGAAPPAIPPAAGRTALRARVDDPTLSADGVHFTPGHALLIGVGQYRDPALRTVATTAADARALGELVCDPALAAYPVDQVELLTDAQATRAALLAGLERLAERVNGGTALIFFAGHGEPVGSSYALLPHDAALDNLAASALTAEVFHTAVARVRARAKRLVVLLNCCHAGGVGDAVLGGAGATGTAPPPEFYHPLATGSGQVVISSSRPGQKSGARSGADPQHTTFGAQVLAALRGAAPGTGPAIGVFDLFAHLRTHVPADAQHIRLVQEPLFYASQLDDNLAVALRPAGGTLGADIGDLARRLVEHELRIEAQGDAAPAALRAERDHLLQQLARP